MKGQSAVEYLMTYGWAILALIIVVSALLATGVLSPNYLVSEECNLGTNFPCNFIIYNEGGETKISIDVYNGFPYRVEIKDFSIEQRDSGAVFEGFDRNVRVESGGSHNYQGTFSGPAMQESAIKRFSVSLTYVSCAPEISEGGGCSTSEHTVTGKLIARITPE